MASADEPEVTEEAPEAIPSQSFTATFIGDPDTKLGVMPGKSDPPDTDNQKAWWDAFQLILQGFHAATQTLSDNYQHACVEVQGIVQRSLRKSTAIDRTFVLWARLHPPVGPGHTPCHGLYGRKCGEAGMPTARGSESREADYGGSVRPTYRRRLQISLQWYQRLTC